MVDTTSATKSDASLIKLILASALALAIVLAGGSVFYYFTIFIPNFEKEKLALEQRKVEQQQQTEKERIEREKQAETDAKNAAAQKESQRSIAYAQCLNNANKAYTSNWANNCKMVAKQNAAKLENCLNNESIMSNSLMGESYCRNQFGQTEENPDCSLPTHLANSVEESFKQQKEQCMEEAKNALL